MVSKHYMAIYLMLALAIMPFSRTWAQAVTFDTNDYRSLGVYDTWPESPFRTGALNGNVAVVDDPLGGSGKNKVLAIQRSRYGSNTFGARIDLNTTFELTEQCKYIHAYIYKEKKGRVMCIGLGKRRDRVGQNTTTEQFWMRSMQPVPTGGWYDAVFQVQGNGGIDIYSLVIVPDAESRHDLQDDFVCYIDSVHVSADPTPKNWMGRKANVDYIDNAITTANDNGTVSIITACRNGEITAADGSVLSSATAGQPLAIKVQGAPGFAPDSLVIRYGIGLNAPQIIEGKHQWEKYTVHSNEISNEGIYVIPAKYIRRELMVTGEFRSTY